LEFSPVPEIEPPPLGSWTALAFLQGPLVEEIGEFIGRVVPVSRGVDAIGKVLPLPWLQRIFKKQKEDTEQQKKEDGKHVIKVSVAIEIVESWLGGMTGTAQEIVDLLHQFLPAPGTEGRGGLVDEISAEIRLRALTHTRRKRINKRFPNRKGYVSDRTRRNF
jgi:hypothetical protein